MNAFNLELARQFIGAVDVFGSDRTIHAIVIRGSGPVFSAGGDVKEMLENAATEDFEEGLCVFVGKRPQSFRGR